MGSGAIGRANSPRKPEEVYHSEPQRAKLIRRILALSFEPSPSVPSARSRLWRAYPCAIMLSDVWDEAGSGTWMLRGEGCRDAAADAIRIGYRKRGNGRLRSEADKSLRGLRRLLAWNRTACRGAHGSRIRLLNPGEERSDALCSPLRRRTWRSGGSDWWRRSKGRRASSLPGRVPRRAAVPRKVSRTCGNSIDRGAWFRSPSLPPYDSDDYRENPKGRPEEIRTLSFRPGFRRTRSPLDSSSSGDSAAVLKFSIFPRRLPGGGFTRA